MIAWTGEAAAWLFDLTVKATVLLVPAWCLGLLLKKTEARIRRAWWIATLAGVLSLPLLAPWVPDWGLPILPPVPDGSAASPEVPELPGSEGPAGAIPARDTGSGRYLHARASSGEIAGTTGGDPPARPRTGTRTALTPAGDHPMRTAVALATLLAWALGSAAVSLRFVAGLHRALRFAARARPLEDPGWIETLTPLLAAIVPGRRIALLVSTEVDTPMTWGWRRPVILVPAAAETWSPERRRIVLSHELVHVRKNDWAFQALAHLACAFYWFHPLAWAAARRWSIERERACDEAVLALGTRPSLYARHLLEITRSISPRIPASVATLAMARRCRLEDRLMAILVSTPTRRRRTLLTAVAFTLMAFLVAAASTVQPCEKPPAPPAPAETPAPPAPGELPGPDSAPAPPALPAPPAPAAMPVAATPVLAPSGAGPWRPPVEAAGLPVTSIPERYRLLPGPVRIHPAPVPAAPGRPVLAARAGESPEATQAYEALQARAEAGTRIHQADDEFSITRTVNGFRIHMQVSGRVEFDEGEAAIRSMAPNAFVVLEAGSDRGRQRLEISGQEEGTLHHEWSVNGRHRTFDDDAREWMEKMLSIFADLRRSAGLRGEANALRGRIHALRGREKALHGRINALHGHRNALQGRINALHGQRNTQLGRINALHGRRNAMAARIHSLQARAARLRAQRELLEARAGGETLEELHRLDDQIESILFEIEELEVMIEDLQADGAEEEILRELESMEIDPRIEEIQGREAELEVERQVAEIEREIAELDAARASAEREQEFLERDAESRAREIDENLKSEIEKLRNLSEKLSGRFR